MVRTGRLLLRPWRRADIPAWTALNADPEVRHFWGGVLDAHGALDLATKLHRHIARYGFGFWAVEAPGVAPFIGAIGLAHVQFRAAFTPAVEVGWRLARPYWGQGYATEGARASLDHAFGPLGLREVVAFVAAENGRSRRVMDKVGLVEVPGGAFDHPGLAESHPFRRHLLYRARRSP